MDIQAKVNLLFNSSNNVKAMASITFDGVFVVTGIKVIEGQKGYFVSMPSRKNANGEYKDICYPITADARAAIQDEILRAYYEAEDNYKAQNNQSNSMVDTWGNPAEYNNFNDQDLPF